MKRYQVRLELDEDGVWIARIPKVSGCHSYGDTIEEALSNVREALGLFVRDAARAELAPRIVLPKNLLPAAAKLSHARDELARALRRAGVRPRDIPAVLAGAQ